MTQGVTRPPRPAQGEGQPASTQGVPAPMLHLDGFGLLGNAGMPLFHPDDGGNAQGAGASGGGNGNGSGNAQGANGGAGNSGGGVESVTDVLTRLLSRHGSSDAVAMHLLNENHRLREERRDLRGRVPAEGHVVLTPEQARAWQTWQQIGQTPEQVTAALTAGREATEREQARTLAEVSGASPTVLQDRLRVTGLRAEVRETPGQNGAAPTRVVHVIQPGANGAQDADLGELRAYAQQHWAAYVPALFPAQGAQQGGTVVTAQAGANAGADANTNPLAAALRGTTPAADGARPVVNALDFSTRRTS